MVSDSTQHSLPYIDFKPLPIEPHIGLPGKFGILGTAEITLATGRCIVFTREIVDEFSTATTILVPSEPDIVKHVLHTFCKILIALTKASFNGAECVFILDTLINFEGD